MVELQSSRREWLEHFRHLIGDPRSGMERLFQENPNEPVNLSELARKFGISRQRAWELYGIIELKSGILCPPLKYSRRNKPRC